LENIVELLIRLLEIQLKEKKTMKAAAIDELEFAISTYS